MNYVTLLKILLEWGIKSKEYNLVLFIYKSFNIGIPVKFLYSLPDNNRFFTLSSFVKNNDVKNSDDENLQHLFSIFKKSKYEKLPEWNMCYGYICDC
jgi:hypothetical protein